MQPSERRDFRDIVVRACQHVLPQCGLAVRLQAGNIDDISIGSAEHLAAFIGFSAGAIRGAVTLIAPVDLVRSSYPLVLKSGIEGQLEVFDWSGEIVNRLLGRIKAGLGARGVDVEPSTPKTMMGEHLKMTVSDSSNVCALRFECASASLLVMVDAIAAENEAFFGAPEGDTASQPEGKLLLF
jgi:CheY-specific phosphatase CheX